MIEKNKSLQKTGTKALKKKKNALRSLVQNQNLSSCSFAFPSITNCWNNDPLLVVIATLYLSVLIPVFNFYYVQQEVY